jgi:hypothetical protein
LAARRRSAVGGGFRLGRRGGDRWLMALLELGRA